MSEFSHKYTLPLQPSNIAEITENLLLFLLSELKAWNLELADKPLSSTLGALVALAISEANNNDGLLDLEKTMIEASIILNDLTVNKKF